MFKNLFFKIKNTSGKKPEESKRQDSAKIKIAFLCCIPPTDKKIWSGTIFKMHEALLSQNFDVEWIPIGDFSPFENRLFKTIENTHKKIFNRGFNANHFFFKALLASKKLQIKLKNSDADLIFAPTNIAEIAFLKTSKHILYLNDATFHQLLNYYGGMSGFGLLSKKVTVLIEKLGLKNADALVFSSSWAANHAEKFYKIEKSKINVIKFGSNASVPSKITQKDYSGEIVFLFLGVDWERKGGQIALDTIKILKQRNFPVKLQVVGCVPPVEAPEVMNIIPFLNKNNPKEAQKILDFLMKSHFIFMPTRADCTPISFCEAASYGLPVISTDTGGVSAVVEDGKTGVLLSIDAGAKEYADKIEYLLLHPKIIENYAVNAREKYETELNWNVWGQKMGNAIAKLVNQKIN